MSYATRPLSPQKMPARPWAYRAAIGVQLCCVFILTGALVLLLWATGWLLNAVSGYVAYCDAPVVEARLVHCAPGRCDDVHLQRIITVANESNYTIEIYNQRRRMICERENILSVI